MRRRPRIPALRTGEAAPAAPRQARSIEKRDRLLEAGRRLFAEKGYEATSIEEITARAETAAGTSTGTLARNASFSSSS